MVKIIKSELNQNYISWFFFFFFKAWSTWFCIYSTNLTTMRKTCCKFKWALDRKGKKRKRAYGRQKSIPCIMPWMRSLSYMADKLRSSKILSGSILIMSNGQRRSNRDCCIFTGSSLVEVLPSHCDRKLSSILLKRNGRDG